jgi:hypothetical protein
MTHWWRIRKWLPDRYGQPCRVLARGSRGTILVEFADAFQVATSWRFVRRLQGDGVTERMCVQCGRVFLAENRRVKICSDECRHQRCGHYQRKYRATPHGKAMQKKADRKRRGSVESRVARRKVRRQRYLATARINGRICLACGRCFVPEVICQVFCSTECRSRRRKEREKRRVRDRSNERNTARAMGRECMECHRIFTPSARALQLLCSEQCRKSRNRKNVRKWRELHPTPITADALLAKHQYNRRYRAHRIAELRFGEMLVGIAKLEARSSRKLDKEGGT